MTASFRYSLPMLSDSIKIKWYCLLLEMIFTCLIDKDFYGSDRGKTVWRWKIIMFRLITEEEQKKKEILFFHLAGALKNFHRGLEGKFKAKAGGLEVLKGEVN